MLPVNGRPQAKATCFTPGSAEMRASAWSWKSKNFKRRESVTLIVNILSVSYPGRTLAKLLTVRISRPAPTSKARVRAV